MRVRTAASDQSQALTRSVAGSTGNPRKESSDTSFDGVMSHVAEDHASNAPDKDAASPKAAPNRSAALPTSGAAGSPAAGIDPLASGLPQILGLTGDTVPSWTTGKVKTNMAAGSKASATDGGKSATQADSGAPLAGALPQTSLLSLVQSAAALPPITLPANAVGDSTVPNATASTTPVMPNGPSPALDLAAAVSTAPLISGVTFQSYLAPVTTGAGPRTAPPGDQAAVPPSAQPVGQDPSFLAGGTSAADAAVSNALATLVAPLAQAMGGKAPTLSLDTATPSSKNGSRMDSAAIERPAPGAALAASFFRAPPQGGDTSGPGQGHADRPALDDKAAESAMPASGREAVDAVALGAPASASVSGPATAPAGVSASAGALVDIPAGATSPAGASALSLETTLASHKSASSGVDAIPAAPPLAASSVVDTAIAMPPGVTLSAPLQSVVDAITTLSAEPAGPIQASADPASRLSPARTMLLQLNPGELGVVNVRLHLTGRTLDVSLTAAKNETADLLDHGRDLLTRAIGDQDYQINSLVIQRGSPQAGDATSLPGSSNATTTDLPRDQGASQGGDTSGGSGRQGADGSPARQGRQPQPRPASPARGTGLFL